MANECNEQKLGFAVPPGLTYVPNYISKYEHNQIWEVINKQTWETALKRRTQQYGYSYNYKNQPANNFMMITREPPNCLVELARRFYQNGLIALLPNQLIVNEYMPGQGITSHVDSTHCFGETILSVSLGSACIMVFTNINTKMQVPVLLEPLSLLLLSNEARYAWTHCIPPRKTDYYDGRRYVRKRRISLTFRRVIN